MTYDQPQLILGPLVGALSHNSANLWGRAQAEATLYAWIGKEPDLSDAILAGSSLPLSPENGYAGVVPVKQLQPDTIYYYSLGFSDRMPRAGKYPRFRTSPLPGSKTPIHFAIGSCFGPRAESDGKVMEVIEEYIQPEELRFIILTGDQIYSDDHRINSLGKVAFSVDEYRTVYEHVWSHKGFSRVLENLPVFMILDDHEVDDDWRWLDPARTRMYVPWWDRILRLARGCSPDEVSMNPQKVRNALQAYWEHQAMHGPGFEINPQLTRDRQYALSEGDDGSLAYTFTCGAAAFFVLDTRTMRSRSRLPWKQRSATILGAGQWLALERWLNSVKDTHPVKFLVSSSAILFDMWLDVARDRWSGYRYERDRLFRFLAEEQIDGVYILAGDLHSSHALRVDLRTPGPRPVSVWEFCSSPLEQKTNWLAKRVYKKLRHPLIAHQECQFILDKNNFGLVRVHFDVEGNPDVRFELYEEDSRKLVSVTTR